MSNSAFEKIGFIGLGVMGEPMCRNLKAKSRLPVLAYDLDAAPLARLVQHGVTACASAQEAVRGADVVFLSLPSGEIVKSLSLAADGLLAASRPGQIFIDTSTSSVEATLALQKAYGARGCTFIDAPIARTRAAAEAGTLSVMVGADAALFEKVRPLIETFAEEITLCGPVGCGQVLKILNNMILFQQIGILSEAKVIGERAGVDPRVLFETLTKGSADSFALRNHGLKAVIPDQFPARAFSVKYAQKDLKYGLMLAQSSGVKAQYAEHVSSLFSAAEAKNFGDLYWPVISRLIGK